MLFCGREVVSYPCKINKDGPVIAPVGMDVDWSWVQMGIERFCGSLVLEIPGDGRYLNERGNPLSLLLAGFCEGQELSLSALEKRHVMLVVGHRYETVPRLGDANMRHLFPVD
jgi:hypothetical protein